MLRLLVVGLLGILTKQHAPRAMGTPQNYDSRIYNCCAPWKGARGSSYLTTFKPAFVEALHLQTDDYSSLFTHLAGLDMGGNAANAPPFPAAAGGAAAGAVQQAEYRRKAESAYVNRASKLQGLLTRHIESKAVTEVISRECSALAGAYRAHIAGGGVHPMPAIVPGAINDLPYGAAAGASTGQHAMAIADRFGAMQQTGLGEVTEESRWANISIRQVGSTRETIVNLKSHIDRIDSQSVARHGAEQRCVKLLSCINFPPELSAEARKEMQRPSYFTPAGGRDYEQTASAFDELWGSYWDAGKIRYQSAPAPSGPPSNRVDAMQLNVEGDYGLETDPDTGEICVFIMDTEGRKVDICWKCSGWGHRKPDCPSKNKTSMGDAHKMLTQLIAGKSDATALVNTPTDANAAAARPYLMTPTNAAARRAFDIRRRAAAGKGAQRRAPPRRGQTFSLEIDEHGNAFDSNGDPLGMVLTEAPISTPPGLTPKESEPEPPPAPEPEPVSAVAQAQPESEQMGDRDPDAAPSIGTVFTALNMWSANPEPFSTNDVIGAVCDTDCNDYESGDSASNSEESNEKPVIELLAEQRPCLRLTISRSWGLSEW